MTAERPDARPSTTGDAVRIEEHAGPRSALRALFELAEDSSAALDAYIDAGRVLVAVEGGRVVGQLQLTDADDPAAAEIKNVAVAPSRQGRGIGRALVRAAIDLARRGGGPGAAGGRGGAWRGARRRRHGEPALLPARRLPDAVRRARRVHGGDRLSAGARDRRHRAARPRLAGSPARAVTNRRAPRRNHGGRPAPAPASATKRR